MNYRALVVVLGLIALAALVYAPAVHHGFISLDDEVYVTGNPPVQAGLTAAGVRWAFSSFRAGFWIPMTWLSLMADATIYGGWPGGYHLTNLLLHAAGAALLFLALRSLTGSTWRSAAAAALFAVHPIHVESVAWVTERKDVLAGVFFMATLLAADRYARRPGRARYLVLAGLFLLGLMSKPMLVTLPFVLLLLDWWPLGRFVPGAAVRLLAEKLPLLLLSIGASVMTLVAHRHVQGLVSVESIPIAARVTNALVSPVRYLQKLVLPWDLALYYPHPKEALPLLTVAGAAALLGLFTCLALAGRRNRPFQAVGWLWFLVMLLPVIGLVQAGGQALAYRFVYLPLIGVYLALTWSVASWPPAGNVLKRLLPVAAFGVIAALAVGARAQLRYWEDSVELSLHTIALTGDNSFIRHNLGLELVRRGRYAEAVTHLAEEVRMVPRSPEARTALAMSLLRAGRIEEASRQLEISLQLDSKNPETLFLGGVLLTRQGRFADSIPWFSRTLAHRPDHADARYNLARALKLAGRTPEAVEAYRNAVRLRPSDSDARLELGALLAGLGRFDEAAEHYRAVLRKKPDSEAARTGLREIGFGR